MGFLKKSKSKGKHLPCNICESELAEVTLYMCPNCNAEGYEPGQCSNCNSMLKEVTLLQCANCGNTIDEQTLKKKWELKKKFKKLTK